MIGELPRTVSFVEYNRPGCMYYSAIIIARATSTGRSDAGNAANRRLRSAASFAPPHGAGGGQMSNGVV